MKIEHVLFLSSHMLLHLYLMADPDSDKKPLPSTNAPSSDHELRLPAALSAYAAGAGSMHQVAKFNVAYSTLRYPLDGGMPWHKDHINQLLLDSIEETVVVAWCQHQASMA